MVLKSWQRSLTFHCWLVSDLEHQDWDLWTVRLPWLHLTYAVFTQLWFSVLYMPFSCQSTYAYMHLLPPHLWCQSVHTDFYSVQTPRVRSRNITASIWNFMSISPRHVSDLLLGEKSPHLLFKDYEQALHSWTTLAQLKCNEVKIEKNRKIIGFSLPLFSPYNIKYGSSIIFIHTQNFGGPQWYRVGVTAKEGASHLRSSR